MSEKHTHILEDGTVVTHSHDHGHTHDPKEVRAIVNRLSKASGHLESVKHMVEEGRDCTEVLIQLAAVKAAISNTGKLILKQHISHCIDPSHVPDDHGRRERSCDSAYSRNARCGV